MLHILPFTRAERKNDSSRHCFSGLLYRTTPLIEILLHKNRQINYNIYYNALHYSTAKHFSSLLMPEFLFSKLCLLEKLRILFGCLNVRLDSLPCLISWLLGCKQSLLLLRPMPCSNTFVSTVIVLPVLWSPSTLSSLVEPLCFCCSLTKTSISTLLYTKKSTSKIVVSIHHHLSFAYKWNLMWLAFSIPERQALKFLNLGGYRSIQNLERHKIHV